jgi:RpiR family transcriptional regulator, carbohydrate utilization regulator
MNETNNPVEKINLPILSLIRSKLGVMTPTQRKIAEFILNKPAEAVKMSISELTSQAGLKSESSVVRFYRTLGFSGYHTFKVTLATEIGGSSFYHTYEDIYFTDSIEDVKRKIFTGAIQTFHENLEMIPASTLQKAVDLIDSAERLFFLGYASSGAIAMDAFFKFCRLKSNCFFCTDSHINAELLASPTPGDVLFCISHSGETRDVVIPAKRNQPIAKVIALTGSPNSQLAKIADVCITTYSEEVNYRTEVMVARLVQMSVIEVLFTACILKKGPNTLENLTKSRNALSYLKF